MAPPDTPNNKIGRIRRIRSLDPKHRAPVESATADER